MEEVLKFLNSLSGKSVIDCGWSFLGTLYGFVGSFFF